LATLALVERSGSRPASLSRLDQVGRNGCGPRPCGLKRGTESAW